MNASDTFSHSISVLLWMVLPVVAGYLLWRVWLKMRPDGERIATVDFTAARNGRFTCKE